MSKAQEIKKRRDRMKSIRGTWENHWQEVSDFFLPRKADFNVTRTEGDKRNNLIFDSTGINLSELLAASLAGFLTNPASQWFNVRIRGNDGADVSQTVKEWLDDTTKRMMAEINAPETAFTSHMHEVYLDIVTFGTGVIFVGESEDETRLLFDSRHLSEVVISESSDGIVDTVLRTFKFTVKQIMNKWPDNTSKIVRDKMEKGNFEDKIEVIHAVIPRKDRDKERKDALNMPWESTYIVTDDDTVLDESGFEEFPYMVPRWTKATGETYGRSPAMTARPDVKQLQEMMSTTIRAAQKIVDPPLLVDDEGVLGPVRTMPGGLNYVRSGSGESVRPLQTGGNIPISFQMMEDVRNRMRTIFFVDQLLFSGDFRMTATEVIQRTEERMRLLGPILGRLQSEFLGPMISRIFGIMFRNGKIKEPPEEIEGEEFEVEYVSPIVRAQKEIEALSILRWMESVSPLLALDPTASQVIDAPETIRTLADINNIPPKLVRDKKATAALVESQNQQAQQQQLIDSAVPLSQAARNIAGSIPGGLT